MRQSNLQSFAHEKYLNLETFKKNGEGVKTPIWFAEREGKLYLYTGADAWKVKRIRNQSRVRIAPCNMRGAVHGEWVEAQAHIVSGEEEKLGHRLLNQKYGLSKRLIDFFSKFKGKGQVVFVIEAE